MKKIDYDQISAVAITIFGVIAIAVSIYISIAAPCSFYKFSAQKDIPARCVEYFNSK